MRLGLENSTVKLLTILAVVAALLGFSLDHRANGQDPAQNRLLDPKAWGDNHVGKPIPGYLPGDECLFCHRNDIGATWQKNVHGVTVRQREDAPELTKMLEAQPPLAGAAKQIEYFLGSRHRVRFKRRPRKIRHSECAGDSRRR